MLFYYSGPGDLGYWGDRAFMEKTLKYGLLIMMILVFILPAIEPSLAADQGSVGVRSGDTVDYTITQKWNTISGNQTVSSNVRIQIIDITGSVVTINETDFATNGAVSGRAEYSFDVSTGAMSNSSFVLGDSTPFLIAAGLGSGDNIYSGLAATINETFTRRFAGSNRKCCFFTIHPNDISVMEWGYYWDQATGILLREFETDFLLNPAGIYRYEMEAVATTLWPRDSILPAASPSAYTLIGGAFALILVTASAIIIHKRGERQVENRVTEVAGEENEMVSAAEVKQGDDYGRRSASRTSASPIVGKQTDTTQLPKGQGILTESAPPKRLKSNVVGHRCIVCELPIRRGDEIVRCPYCKNVAHKTHMSEWLHVKGTCPVCRRDVEHFLLKVFIA